MNKLKESIPASNMKVIDLFNKINNDTLELRPYFQRKLVWRKSHKINFIETVLANYPFPEIYIATGKIDLTSLKSKEWVVDGQQRLSALRDYILGDEDLNNQSIICPFQELSDNDKQDFLNYNVIVRDLKTLSEDIIKEVFQRINNTEYALNTTEKINASYGDSEFVLFCRQVIDKDFDLLALANYKMDSKIRNKLIGFFHDENDIFNDNDERRMHDLQYIMVLITALISGYSNRNYEAKRLVETYFEEFPEADEIANKLISLCQFIASLNLNQNSYWFNKANIFTLIVELSKKDITKVDTIKCSELLQQVEMHSKEFISNPDSKSIPSDQINYFNAAREGINNKKERMVRGEFISKLIDKSIK